jgi:predicted transcriptional regulator
MSEINHHSDIQSSLVPSIAPSKDTNAQFKEKILEMTTEIVVNAINRFNLHPDQVPEYLKSVYASLEELHYGPKQSEPEPEALQSTEETSKPNLPKREPFVDPAQSVQKDYIICLEDGAQKRTLKRYLMSKFGLTPEEYIKRWNLPEDYPMTAPGYTEERSAMAKKLGLGRKPGQKNKPKEAAASDTSDDTVVEDVYSFDETVAKKAGVRQSRKTGRTAAKS